MATDQKATSIRMDAETRDMLSNVTEQMGVNQGTALKSILQNFLDSAAYIGDDQQDLENALYYVQGISDQIRQLIRSRSEAQDRAQKAVQSKIEALQGALEKSQEENRKYRDQIKDQLQKITELSAYKSEVETAKREAEEARAHLADSRKLVEVGEAERQSMAGKIARIDELEAENERLKHDVSEATRKNKQIIDDQRANYMLELAQAKQDFAEEIKTAREEAIKSESDRLMKENDRLREDIKELKSELRALRMERQPEALREIEDSFKVKLPNDNKK